MSAPPDKAPRPEETLRGPQHQLRSQERPPGRGLRSVGPQQPEDTASQTGRDPGGG